MIICLHNLPNDSLAVGHLLTQCLNSMSFATSVSAPVGADQSTAATSSSIGSFPSSERATSAADGGTLACSTRPLSR
jgi:hypothetical protein